jgi:uncharacterized protein YdhG (YjbR/CyaY superfamily)
MKKGAKPMKNVDAYIDALPTDMRIVLTKIRDIIKAAAPKAEESISYGMPAYKYYGPLVYFGAFANHCSFFPGSKAAVQAFSKELEDFKTSAGTIQFTTDKPLPATLVKKMVKIRMKENEEKNSLKAMQKSAVKKSTKTSRKLSV